MDKLPSTVYADICAHLPDLRDVLALERSCRRVRTQLKAVFWGRPRRLRLTDGDMAQVFLDEGSMHLVPARLNLLNKVCARARNLTDLDLAAYTCLPDQFLKGICRIVRRQNMSVTSLSLNYQNPELMYSPASEEGFEKYEEDPPFFPSRDVHKALCKLVESQSRHLQQLFIRINSISFLSMQRDFRSAEIEVEFACDYSHELRTVLFPFFSGFTKDMNNMKPRVLRLGLRGEGECVLPAFDFCTHAAIPFDRRGYLEELHYRVAKAETAAILNCDAFMPRLVANLKKLCLFIDDHTVDEQDLRQIGANIKPNKFSVQLNSRSANLHLPAMAC